MIKGFLFDYGATLDTAGCHWGQMLWAAYQRCEVPVTEQQFRDAYVYGERTLGSKTLIAPEDTFRVTLGVKLQLEFDFLMQEGALKMNAIDASVMRERVLNDVYSCVQKTTKESRMVLEKLKEFDLDVFFKSIVESAEVGIRKPDARIYEMGVQELGFEPAEVAVVGDSFQKDMMPAKQIGCCAVWLKGKAWKQETVDETMVNHVIYSLNELLTLPF